MAAPDLAGALLVLLAHEVEGDARIDDLRRLSGGASRETWSFDLRAPGTTHELILQRLRPGGGAGSGLPLGTEAALVRAAGEHGVPVARVMASDDGAILGTPGMVTERLAGETIARRLLRDAEWSDARTRLGAQVAEAAAVIHAMPIDAVVGLASGDQLDQCRMLLDGLAEPHPAFELGVRWLEAHRPVPSAPAIVHGDLRMGNLLVDHGGLRAVLDWELAHVGDALEDLGWFCVRAWRFGSPLEAGGVATRAALVDAYVAASGRSVDPQALRWWEVLGTLKWGAICMLQAWGHLSGATRSVELATIGRRVCENEWDLLGLLPGGPLLRVSTTPAPSPGPVLHDRPSVAELVEAAREWVEADVRDGTEGRLAFDARVAANALRMVERELALEPGLTRAHATRLAELGCADDGALVGRIRSGELDDRAEEVRTLVAASVHDKLLVANPGWLAPEG